MRNRAASRSVVLAGCAYLASGLVAVQGTEIARTVGGVLDSSGGGYPRIPFESLGVVFFVLPVVIVAAMLFWLLPGLIASAVWGRSQAFADWIVSGFLVAFFLQMTAHILTGLVGQLTRQACLTSNAVMGVAVIAAAYRRLRSNTFAPVTWTPTGRRRAIVMVAVPVVALWLLLPYFFSQDFNPDGVEALAIGQSLSHHLVPRALAPPGPLGIGTGIVSTAYLYHMFLMLFGPVEASVRLPLLLLLAILFAGLLSTIEWDQKRPMQLAHETLLLGALAIYVVVIGLNASYDPYSADIAAPGVQETLVVVSIVGVIVGLASNRPAVLFGYTVLACLARPTGVLFIGLLPAAALCFGGSFRSRWFRMSSFSLLIAVILIVVYQGGFVHWMNAAEQTVGNPHDTLSRLRFLTFSDWRRFGFLLFPSGILPGLALLCWSQQDELARVTTAVTLPLFLFFYSIAFVALHHFVIGMVLPLIVFWRLYLRLSRRWRFPVYAWACVGLCVAMWWWSLPRSSGLVHTARDIGRRTLYLVGDPGAGPADALEQGEVLREIVSLDWDAPDPTKQWVGSPPVLMYYADRIGPLSSRHDYVVLASDAVPPEGWSLMREQNGAVLYARDPITLEQDRHRTPRTDYRSLLYDIPRSTLFRHWGEPRGNYDIDLGRLFRRR